MESSQELRMPHLQNLFLAKKNTTFLVDLFDDFTSNKGLSIKK
jgi:hypothetical protein